MLLDAALTPEDLLLLAHQDELDEVLELEDVVVGLLVEPDEQVSLAVLDVHLRVGGVHVLDPDVLRRPVELDLLAQVDQLHDELVVRGVDLQDGDDLVHALLLLSQRDAFFEGPVAQRGQQVDLGEQLRLVLAQHAGVLVGVDKL